MYELLPDGLVRHDQLADLGVTGAALRARLGSGRWRQVLPSVYATFDGYLSDRQRWAAACLYAGPGATLAGGAALRLHGVARVPADRYVRVLVPHSRQVPSVDFVRVHRTRRPDADAYQGVCSLARATADAGRWCGDLRAVRELVAEVVYEHRCPVDVLRREVDLGPAGGSGLIRLALQELVSGELVSRELPTAAG